VSTSPTLAAGSYPFTVSAISGSLGRSVGFRLTLATPSAHSIFPTLGPLAGGTPVIVSGTNFRPGTIVTLDGAALAGQQVLDPGTISGFTPPHTPGTTSLTVLNPDGQTATVADAFGYLGGGLQFYTLTPCRLIDTRTPNDAPALLAGSDREFVATGRCGIPATARALVANLTVTSSSSQGRVLAYPTATAKPTASTLNYRAGQTRANNAVVALNPAGRLTVSCSQAFGSTHFVMDVTGYME
jgi:hypothetical protein